MKMVERAAASGMGARLCIPLENYMDTGRREWNDLGEAALPRGKSGAKKDVRGQQGCLGCSQGPTVVRCAGAQRSMAGRKLGDSKGDTLPRYRSRRRSAGWWGEEGQGGTGRIKSSMWSLLAHAPDGWLKKNCVGHRGESHAVGRNRQRKAQRRLKEPAPMRQSLTWDDSMRMEILLARECHSNRDAWGCALKWRMWRKSIHRRYSRYVQC